MPASVSHPGGFADTAAVVIGRNEGPHLARCIASLKGVSRVIYVDSGSADNSLKVAETAHAHVVSLDPGLPFTAARARNAGLAELGDEIEFVQFVDGDCVVRDGWLAEATRFLRDTPGAAVVCGRRRERFPEHSVYNRLCDREWDTPVGQARACGGDALMRLDAVRDVGGYRDGLIAGEEPELCVRLRQAGWEIWRIDAEMTWHDAAMERFGQWFKRCRRAGHAYAEGAHLHGAPPERHWTRETRRALAWGLILPLLIVAVGLMSPWGWLLVLAYPAQVLRLAPRLGTEAALFTVLGKFPEALGVIGFHLSRLRGRRAELLEYK